MRGLILSAVLALAAAPAAAEDWKPIFNGRDLTGWTPKINHHPLGENWRDTFQAKDGMLVVSYAGYDKFNNEFGHLIYKTPLSSYRLRFEYRFVGPTTPGAPTWAIRNSGVMLHGQSPESMALDQSFPVSVEAQILAIGSGAGTTTGNVCTPGVTVSVDGVPLKPHCLASKEPSRPEGEWVRFEVEVHGSRLIRQLIDGKTVMEYGDIRLDPSEFAQFGATPVDPAKAGTPVDRGYISLQAEGHPLEFRKIELLELRD